MTMTTTHLLLAIIAQESPLRAGLLLTVAAEAGGVPVKEMMKRTSITMRCQQVEAARRAAARRRRRRNRLRSPPRRKCASPRRIASRRSWPGMAPRPRQPCHQEAAPGPQSRRSSPLRAAALWETRWSRKRARASATLLGPSCSCGPAWATRRWTRAAKTRYGASRPSLPSHRPPPRLPRTTEGVRLRRLWLYGLSVPAWSV